MTSYVEMSGEPVSANELQITKARKLVQALEHLDYVSPVCCVRESDGSEVVVFDTEVEIPQRKVHDIRRFERIAVRFQPTDEAMPETLALRFDFPTVPHLNLRQQTLPRSLCIFDEPYNELKLHWTAPFYIRNVREWLSLTAKGQLHADDQPLEPLLIGSEGYLVLPPDVLNLKDSILVIKDVVESHGQVTLTAQPAESLDSTQDGIRFLVSVLRAKSQSHGLIHAKPRNLSALHSFLESGEIDLLKDLRQSLRQWKEVLSTQTVRNTKLIVLILLPKSRNDDDNDVESIEMRAFITHGSIMEIGVAIGIWEVLDGEIGQILSVNRSKTGATIDVSMLNPLLSFSAKLANLLSGVDDNTELKIAAVGVGALGSQVILNLIRMGYGRWTLIDDDILLPHNLARHALTKHFVGYPKAIGLSALAQQMVDDDNVAVALVENVGSPTETAKLMATLGDAQVILDASTSVAAARHLTYDIDSAARRISIFLNPTATDVVILAEDRARNVKLDLLEMQYYRSLIRESDLAGHLQLSDDRIRYGTSCRDLSSRIPQDLVALHSAICTRAIRQIIMNDGSAIAVWRTNSSELTTTKLAISVGNVTEIMFDHWTLVTDSCFLNEISRIRDSKIPNETGGVLIGSYDTARRIVYVVDTVPAPHDSVEWPTVFIRGSRGLRQDVERIRRLTDGQLVYVGEWHSHPPGVRGIPSSDDFTAFSWLSEMMTTEGLPALMLIAADNSEYSFYLGQMENNC